MDMANLTVARSTCSFYVGKHRLAVLIFYVYCRQPQNVQRKSFRSVTTTAAATAQTWTRFVDGAVSVTAPYYGSLRSGSWIHKSNPQTSKNTFVQTSIWLQTFLDLLYGVVFVTYIHVCLTAQYDVLPQWMPSLLQVSIHIHVVVWRSGSALVPINEVNLR